MTEEEARRVRTYEEVAVEEEQLAVDLVVSLVVLVHSSLSGSLRGKTKPKRNVSVVNLHNISNRDVVKTCVNIFALGCP